MPVPVGCLTTTMFGRVHQNAALGHSLLSVIDLCVFVTAECLLLRAGINVHYLWSEERTSPVGGLNHCFEFLQCFSVGGQLLT